MRSLELIRSLIRKSYLMNEREILNNLVLEAKITPDSREGIAHRAAELVNSIRDDNQPGLMEIFLSEYGLSTNEGIALMCLAEALLRVPDNETIDDLISDKIAPSSWGRHLGQSSSSLVNASTWALMLTGKVLDNDTSSGLASVLHSTVKRLGEPVIRAAVRRIMKEMGNQFVLGETIEQAAVRAETWEQKGYTYSYDMLGEAAVTAHDASGYFEAYNATIEFLATHANADLVHENPGISVKLSALHPRYEVSQKSKAAPELTDRVLALALRAKQARIGLNIDAEEADRLDMSLDIIEAVLRDERLANWDGFGVVIQAYGKRASYVIDWVYSLSVDINKKIMVRLVKGAYWDTEIKRAQINGIRDFPVLTQKSATDVSYICCAKKLLGMTDRIYPQFATHNAHTVSAILELSSDNSLFEFQRLHGMGEVLHRLVHEKQGTRCRIYAPVGAHRDLLAYLVRRLLENGANSSFVNQIVDKRVPVDDIVTDPFEKSAIDSHKLSAHIKNPNFLYAPKRRNSRGWDINNEDDLVEIDQSRTPFKSHQWIAKPLMACKFKGYRPRTVFNPANPDDVVGSVVYATREDAVDTINSAKDWAEESGANRARILNRAADFYEENYGELFAALTREAGKNTMDAIAELREAVDFLRYYATQIKSLENRTARGVIACISPWNFPLAIFTGQVAAALAAGNGVLAKPADPTPIVATIAVKLMHKAGVPKPVLQLLPGRGSVVGAAISEDSRIGGICFTGSTSTAQTINKAMAENISPDAALIAETGGINAMVVDSTALPEQAVKDIIASSFQSAGQRCSALRILYLQLDCASDFMGMLLGAMDELAVDDPWLFSTDVGPVINADARDTINCHLDIAKREGRLIKQLEVPGAGNFVGPSVVKVNGIEDIEEEIFGPVLHVATFKADEIDHVIASINSKGYGLTFGLHTRIDGRVEQMTSQLKVGNFYINRNQIGAIVGSQPFGGEGLSGTGPKAGGPNYVQRFTADHFVAHKIESGQVAPPGIVQEALNELAEPLQSPLTTWDLPGPTGESNRLSLYPRGKVLCLGPTLTTAWKQADIARKKGCSALIVTPGATGKNAISGFLSRESLLHLEGFDAVALWSNLEDLREVRKYLSHRNGALIPLITDCEMSDRCTLERHVCIDTTSAGGNATLLAQIG